MLMCFTLRPATFELQLRHFETRALIMKDPRLKERLQRQRHPTSVLLVSLCSKYQPVLLFDQPFLSYRRHAPNDDMTWKTTRLNIPHTCIYVISVPQS